MSLSDLQYVPILDNGADTGQGAAFNLSLDGEVKHNGLESSFKTQLTLTMKCKQAAYFV